MAVISPAARPDLIRRAFCLEWFTTGWMLIEAAIAIGSGAAAHSLSLIAFGADSLIELNAAGCGASALPIMSRSPAARHASASPPDGPVGRSERLYNSAPSRYADASPRTPAGRFHPR